MKTPIIAAIIATSSVADANADWFARFDSSNRLVVTGVATDDNGVLSPITLTCDGNRLTAEILTLQNATKEDVPTYEGVKVKLGYKAKNGDKQKMGLDSAPVLLPGNALGIVSVLSADQSQAIYTALGRGSRVDLELVHPELDPDITTKKVYAWGSSQALLSMHEHCPGLE